MQATIQSTPAYQLNAEPTQSALGHNLKFTSFVPTARRPEQQVKFQGVFTTDELRVLRDLIDQELQS
jgi:hypothetical protein